MSVIDTELPSTPAKPIKKKKKSGRKKLYEWHTWVGFHMAIIMVIVLFTGTVATVSHEIDWLAQHDMRVAPDGDRVSWQEMHDAVQAHVGDGHIGRIVDMGGDHFAFRTDVIWPSGERQYVHVNQWTGEVTGMTDPLTVQRIFRDLHRYLFMPSVLGLPIVCSMAFLLAISLYTGLKTTRNWTTLMTRVRFSKGARIAVGDAHKAAGLWGSWFFIVMIVTGIWYLAEFGAALAGERFEPGRPSITAEHVAAHGDTIPIPDVDDIVAVVREAYPDLMITQILWPFSPTGHIFVGGDVGNPIIRDRANGVFLDPGTLEILEVKYSNQMGWVAWLNETADPLHFGFFGGLPTKLIWFIFGVAMTALSVTGVWLTWKRLKTSAVSRAQFATFPVVLLTMVFGYFYLDRYKSPYVPGQERVLTADVDRSISATPAIELGPEGRPTGLVRLQFDGGNAIPNAANVALSTVHDGQMVGELQVKNLRAIARVIEARVILPEEALASADGLVAEVALNSGEVAQFEWTLAGAWQQARLKGSSNDAVE